MKYKYKDEILLDIGPEPNCNYESESNRYYDKIDELDHVYAQADLNKEKIKQIEETYKVRYSEHIELKRKADEYEAKAKAWDEFIENINKSVDEYEEMFNESGMSHYRYQVEIHDGLLDVANQILEELESGEYDA